MKKLYVAATRQNDGKTTLSLGLLQILSKRLGEKVGFMKPVGQKYVEKEGYKVDEDVVLMKEVCRLKGNLKDMNPITVERGFTEEYIKRGNKEKLVKEIKDAFFRLSRGKKFMLVEGTGHAGVGAVFDLSNAEVAGFLGTKVLLVTIGGIGRPIDEIVINKALFDREKVEIIGVVINKVLPGKYEKIKKLVREGLKKKGIEVIGVIPYEEPLILPTMEQIKEATRAEVIHGESFLDKKVAHIVVGAMEPHHALGYFRTDTLVVTPGDREDIILSTLLTHLSGKEEFSISGMVLTGGLLPHERIMELIEKEDIPVLLSKDDTYTTTKKIHDRRIKIRPSDRDKIKEVEKLIKKYVEVERILEKV